MGAGAEVGPGRSGENRGSGEGTRLSSLLLAPV